MIDSDSLPSFAYVPGQNQRHAESAFDNIRATAKVGMSEDELANCAALRVGLHYLHHGYFWEAHEVLEPVWMALPPNSVARSVTQGLIQLANACLKEKMAKPKAAARLLHKAREHLLIAQGAPVLGMETQNYLDWVDSMTSD